MKSEFESKVCGFYIYYGYYFKFVEWQKSKDPNWEPNWSQGEVELANELMFCIENFENLKNRIQELGDKRKVFKQLEKYYRDIRNEKR